ncbi:MAG: sensor histidine kinase [Pseudomonadota bacterium]
MTRTLSLRMRLTLIILLPILAVALAAGLWQLSTARTTAAQISDRGLLSTALAVSNDVAFSGGDALSPRTLALLADTSGGRVFYHVYAPDGVIVAGYATPPVGIPRALAQPTEPTYFEATYLGRDVRGVRLQSRTEIEGFAGIFTTTVWQDQEVRDAFVRDLMLRTLATILILVLSLALIVWFGVRIGLRPLLDLEDAIRRRSGSELHPIRREVPEEVAGVVSTLNGLFNQVSRSMSAQGDFILNAAHQLRNPIAGVLSLAEAVDRAPNRAESRKRAADLLIAARETADLSQKLLLYERIRSSDGTAQIVRLNLADALTDWLPGFRGDLPEGVQLEAQIAEDVGAVDCDPTMLREALRNLCDNAVRHGGPGVTRIGLSAIRDGQSVQLIVRDNGHGVDPAHLDAIFDRFRQLSAASGSGLGLSIVRAFAERHGGRVAATDAAPGLEVTVSLPVADVTVATVGG